VGSGGICVTSLILSAVFARVFKFFNKCLFNIFWGYVNLRISVRVVNIILVGFSGIMSKLTSLSIELMGIRIKLLMCNSQFGWIFFQHSKFLF